MKSLLPSNSTPHLVRLWQTAVVATLALSVCGTETLGKEITFVKEPAFEDNFDSGWEARQNQWRVATWKQNKTQMSPERCEVNDEGMLVQTVLAGEPAMGGSLQTTREFGYGRWQARLKPSPVAGVINTMFTMDWDDLTTSERDDDGTKTEIDIEFLTYTFEKNGGKVHLAIHLPGEKNHFEADLPLDFNPSDEFRVWGFDILPDRVRWHVDGKIIQEYVLPEGKELAKGYELFFNAWTARKWVKGPPEEKTEYFVDWVRFHPVAE